LPRGEFNADTFKALAKRAIEAEGDTISDKELDAIDFGAHAGR
jgi:hypothetical protein